MFGAAFVKPNLVKITAKNHVNVEVSI